MSLDEAAQRLLGAFLVEFADRDDDDLIPLRLFIVDVGRACGVETEALDVPEWETAGWLRARSRAAFARLAAQETAVR